MTYGKKMFSPAVLFITDTFFEIIKPFCSLKLSPNAKITISSHTELERLHLQVAIISQYRNSQHQEIESPPLTYCKRTLLLKI